MNSKHLACGIVALFIVLLVQATMWVQKASAAMQKEAANAQSSEKTASEALGQGRVQLADLRRQSANLITFLKTWQPYFQTLDNPQSAEINFTMKVKESNLVNLSQRFEPVDVKGNASVPKAMRAILIFEDDYVRLLHWLGQIEASMPTVRVSSTHFTKGTRANDLRMEVAIDQPLIKK